MPDLHIPKDNKTPREYLPPIKPESDPLRMLTKENDPPASPSSQRDVGIKEKIWNADSLNRLQPPPELIAQHAAFANHYWTTLADERAGRTLSPQEHQADRIKLDEKARDIMSRAAPWMRMKEDALLSVLDSGRFKSQFETKSSFGHLDENTRAKNEKALFGYSTDLPQKEPPLYGYVSEDPDGKLGGSWRKQLDNYGTVAIHFKEAIKDRTTVTMADSLECTDDGTALSIRAVPFHHPDRHMFLLTEREKITGGRKAVKNPLDYTSVDEVSPFAEAQYHGGLKSSDIAEVVFDYQPSKSLTDRLRNVNIPYRVHREY